MHVERWADRWGMECGVRKCGIMLVPTTHPTDSIATLTELGPWQLHGQDVPIVDSYRYLGYEFTNDLTPDRHMELRREGARKAFAACMSFLQNRSIPLHNRAVAYKVMVLPILTWGCELLPANKGALGPMSAVQNKQLRALAGLRETSRQGCPWAMGIELDIPPFYVRAVTSRLRLYIKAPVLSTWLRVLVANPCKLPSRGKRPWTTLSRSLMVKKESIPRDHNVHFLEWLREWEWRQFTSTSGISRALAVYKERGYACGRKYLLDSIFNLDQATGQLCLFKMRTGCFPSAQRLAQMRLISPEYLRICPFCQLGEPEDVDHLLIRCEFFAAQRARFFFPLAYLNLDQRIAASVLLGGEHVGDDGTVGPVYHDGNLVTLVTTFYSQFLRDDSK